MHPFDSFVIHHIGSVDNADLIMVFVGGFVFLWCAIIVIFAIVRSKYVKKRSLYTVKISFGRTMLEFGVRVSEEGDAKQQGGARQRS